jgi:hypothetical protein
LLVTVNERPGDDVAIALAYRTFSALVDAFDLVRRHAEAKTHFPPRQATAPNRRQIRMPAGPTSKG